MFFHIRVSGFGDPCSNGVKPSAEPFNGFRGVFLDPSVEAGAEFQEFFAEFGGVFFHPFPDPAEYAEESLFGEWGGEAFDRGDDFFEEETRDGERYREEAFSECGDDVGHPGLEDATGIR